MRNCLEVIALLLAIGWTSCRSQPVAVGSLEVNRNVDCILRLPAGSIVRLVGSEGAPAAGSTGEVADGWLREALRQSPWLDIAAGPVQGPSSGAASLRMQFDARSQTVEARLVDDRTLLATASLQARPVHAAIDELAVRIRLALGDPIEEPPAPLQRIYSADAFVVAACEAAWSMLHEGRFAEAARALAAVRRNDGACAYLLDLAASAAAMQGNPSDARKFAQEALSLSSRLSPTTTHRLLRTMLLARASLEPQLAARYDEELATLAQVGMRERPHDPEPRLTEVIADNFCARFDHGLARAESLLTRLPSHPAVHYHAGWAALGAGQHKRSADAFRIAAAAMPIGATVVPRSIALFEAGAQTELVALLAATAADPSVQASAALHEVVRMQAAHALLTGDLQRALAHAFEDLDWLRQRPATQSDKAGELAETVETLVRLGAGNRIRPYLTEILDREANTSLADAAVFGLAMAECASTRTRAETAETGLRRRTAGFLADTLAAFGFHQRGELAAENQALGAAAAQSSSPLLTAALVQNLRTQGREQDAVRLHEAMRRELTRIHLRRKIQHPLLGIELAYAYLAR